MRQLRFNVSWPSPTILILPLTVMLIAASSLAFATEPADAYTYAATGQSQAQKTWDRYECHSCSLGRAGLDMSRLVAQAAVSTPIPTTPYQRPQRHVARGAARGAAVGAVGGAIAGDPAKGAAAGAAMGGTVGVFRRRDQRRQQAIQQQPIPPQP